MKQVQYWQPTNIKRQPRKFSVSGDLALDLDTPNLVTYYFSIRYLVLDPFDFCTVAQFVTAGWQMVCVFVYVLYTRVYMQQKIL